MKKLIIFLAILLLPATASAEPRTFGDFHGAQYVSNFDGNSITFNLNWIHQIIGDKINVQVYGVDIPEIRGECEEEKALADEARIWVMFLLMEADNISLMNMQRGKYFRIVADVVADGINIKDSLIENGFGVAYFGEKKGKSWCQ